MEEKQKQAKSVYEAMCKFMDSKNLYYTRDDEKLIVKLTAQGDDLPIECIFSVDTGRQLLNFLSFLPFKVPQEKLVDMAIAITAANGSMVNGSFCLNLNDGSLFFRLSEYFCDSILGNDVYDYVLQVSASTVDKYNDKFFMISKGSVSVDQFLDEFGLRLA